MNNEYAFSSDIALMCDLLGMSDNDLAQEIGIEPMTLNRWKSGTIRPLDNVAMLLYNFAFAKGVRLNAIKAQLHEEGITANGHITVFHGAKTQIDGELSLSHSKKDNDFGRGFYCGESLEQSAMFVSGYPASSIYVIDFNPAGLNQRAYQVNQDWMLSIAWFRGKLRAYAKHEKIKCLLSSFNDIDYVVAPIADNRMFEIIDNFIDGEITDVQCQHCLSATNLGSQYVLLSEKALKQASIVERCFLANEEKGYYVNQRDQEASIGRDKVKAALRQFRGQGFYIEELLS